MGFVNNIWSKPENKFILISIAFAFIYFQFLLDHLTKLFGTSSPFIKFLIFYAGIGILFSLFFTSFARGTSFTIKNTVVFTLASVLVDLLKPEFHISKSGELVSYSTYSAGAPDYVIGSWLASVGVPQPLLFTIVYVGVFGLILFILNKTYKKFMTLI